MSTTLNAVKLLIDQTGRTDLVVNTTTFAEPSNGLGARFWLNRAQRLLDRIQQTPQSDAWHLVKPVAGTYTIALTQCRAITELWYTDSDGKRDKVDRVDLSNLREYYYKDPTEYDQGIPLHWALQSFRQEPGQQGTTPSTDDYEDLYIGAADTYQGLIFMPPSDGNITYRIKGKWYSKALTADNDTSYWTQELPEALVLATRWFIEGTYKNEGGMETLMAALDPLLHGIELDMIEAESYDVKQMEG